MRRIKIPTQIQAKTSFMFEVKDNSFEHIGIKPKSMVLVNDKPIFTTKRPIAFFLKKERMVGLAQRILADLYQLKPENENVIPILFSKNEIEMIGQITGFYTRNENKDCLEFEKL